MPRGTLHISALLLVLAPCLPAFAHGIPPEAYTVISHDADGPRAVSLSAGVALRRSAQRYQFVCPSAWGDQFAAPVAALADGTIVVGASSGLMLLGEDGTLRAHPDPAAVGRSADLVRSARGVFSLRSTPAGSELLAVDAQTVRVLWRDANSFSSLAALDDKLVLLRGNGMIVEQVILGAVDGALLERQVAISDLPVDYVFARANAGAAYAIVVLRSGTVELGSLHMNAFSMLASGELSIAGPLSVENVTLLALDGKLAQLIDGHTTPLADEHNVVCLSEHDGLGYACDADGIARVGAQALGEPLFRFGWLTAPDLTQVPEGDKRMLCNAQWQDFLLDLQLTMPDLSSAPAAAAMTGGSYAQAPGAMLTTGGSYAQLPGAAPATAGIDAQAGGGGALVVPSQRVQDGGTGCAALPARRTPRAADVYVFGLVVTLTVVRCRRGRRRR